MTTECDERALTVNDWPIKRCNEVSFRRRCIVKMLRTLREPEPTKLAGANNPATKLRELHYRQTPPYKHESDS